MSMAVKTLDFGSMNLKREIGCSLEWLALCRE